MPKISRQSLPNPRYDIMMLKHFVLKGFLKKDNKAIADHILQRKINLPMPSRKYNESRVHIIKFNWS